MHGGGRGDKKEVTCRVSLKTVECECGKNVFYKAVFCTLVDDGERQNFGAAHTD